MRRVKSYSTSKVLSFEFWPRKSQRWSWVRSAPELALCCGQVAAVKGGGQVATLKTLGLERRVAPKSWVVLRSQLAGIRKFEKRKLSTRRSFSLTCTVTPRSELPTTRFEFEGPLIRPTRSRVRVARPAKSSYQLAILLSDEL